MDKQDEVDRGLRLFGRPVPFPQAHPTISDLRVVVNIRLGGWMDEHPRQVFFTMANPPGEYVRCPRSSCAGGGWCIGDVLREMVACRETSRKAGGTCEGRQRMGRHSSRECLALFQAEIEIRYRPKDDAADSQT